jgi:hypothetical protein
VFLTYAHYTPQGRLFYIGKASNSKRAYDLSKRNVYWHRIVGKHGTPRVEILADWDTEKEALDHEILLISCFRDMGYQLANLTGGGEGSLGITPWNKGKPWSDEVKVKCGLLNKGNTHWIGRKHSEESKKKQSLTKAKFKYIGTNVKTGETVTCIGRKAINQSGFVSTHVYRCVQGISKLHKGYTWHKEILENTL